MSGVECGVSNGENSDTDDGDGGSGGNECDGNNGNGSECDGSSDTRTKTNKHTPKSTTRTRVS
jgi:hypothetical protein